MLGLLHLSWFRYDDKFSLIETNKDLFVRFISATMDRVAALQQDLTKLTKSSAPGGRKVNQNDQLSAGQKLISLFTKQIFGNEDLRQ